MVLATRHIRPSEMLAGGQGRAGGGRQAHRHHPPRVPDHAAEHRSSSRSWLASACTSSAASPRRTRARSAGSRSTPTSARSGPRARFWRPTWVRPRRRTPTRGWASSSTGCWTTASPSGTCAGWCATTPRSCWARRRRRRSRLPASGRSRGPQHRVFVLSTRGLSKSYGPFRAVDDVDLDIREHDIHVFIGPNGAGKSTVLNMLGGQILPTSGEIYLRRPAARHHHAQLAARAGIGRSFQLTSIIPGFTCLENVVLAVQAQRGLFGLLRLSSRPRTWRWPTSCSTLVDLRARCRRPGRAAVARPAAAARDRRGAGRPAAPAAARRAVVGHERPRAGRLGRPAASASSTPRPWSWPSTTSTWCAPSPPA